MMMLIDDMLRRYGAALARTRSAAQPVGRGRLALMSSAATVLALCSSPAHVQEQNTTAGANPSAEDSSQIAEVLVTAQRRTESAQKVPISIVAATAEDLRDHAVTQSKDLTSIVPNLQWKGDGLQLGNTIFLRGIGTNAFGGPAVPAVGSYVDEVNLNNPRMVGFFLFDVDRVEVLRGPQGTLYGRNTTGGAINYFTKAPVIGGPADGYLQGTLGSFRDRELEGATNIPISPALAARLSFSAKGSDGSKRNIATGERSRNFDAYGARGQLLYAPTEAASALFSLHWGKVKSSDILYKQLGLIDPTTGGRCAKPVLGGPCTDLFGFRDNSDFNVMSSDLRPVGNEREYGGLVKLTVNFSRATLTAISGYENSKDERGQDEDASSKAVLNSFLPAPSHQFSQEVRLSSADTVPLNWTVGANYFAEKMHTGTTLLPLAFGPGFVDSVVLLPQLPYLEGVWMDYHQDTKATAAFAQATYRLIPELALTSGLRWTHETKSFTHTSNVINLDAVPNPAVVAPDESLQSIVLYNLIRASDERTVSKPSWRFAADYDFSSDVLGYASVTRSFKSGVGNDQATFSPVEAGLTNPEYLTAYEIGVKSYLLSRKLRLNAATFYYNFSDQQVTTFVPPTPGAIPVNVQSNAGRSRVYGGEIELLAKPAGGWTFGANVGILNAKFVQYNPGPPLGDLSGNKLPAAPDLSFSGSVAYEHPVSFGALTAALDGSYRSKQFFSSSNDPLLSQPAYWLANARLAASLLSDKLAITLSVKNLFDKKYLIDAFDVSSFGYDLLNVSEQRSVSVAVRYSF